MMRTASCTFQPQKGAEPIPGYVLEEQIGAGGYGEVWRASAPGGLSKAVKFVYGQLEGARANRELKSLNRIKQVQHPFLLSLERIEIVDGQLLIVTELARCSLKERFNECIEQGLEGIPREELLSYMADAADALDFLCEEQSLLHLDIKPENLLVVSSHVKVGDFGLVKSLQEDNNASMVDGLTPKYSPPEVLNSQPHKNSDQYSLAVLYQEMLTGEWPFEGRTAMQLAAQHLHGTPNLSRLPPSDRFAIGKALSKNPAHRFERCRELVQYLRHPPRNASAIVTVDVPVRKDAPAAIETPNEGSDAATHDGRTQAVDRFEAKSLPALVAGDESYALSPTLFIGIGGLAARMLQRLRHRLDDRFGELTSVPAVRMLLLDTDIDAITEFATSRSNTSSEEVETIALPLRQPKDYQNSGVSKLRSIGHRWIYNIPRSRSTERLRALGRLAFLDHSQRILERLRHAVSTVTDAANVEASAKNTSQSFDEKAVRVFVVGAISGGTGGGMLLDVGYAVRQVLAENCLSDEHVYGLLMHTAPNEPKARSLAMANAYACLDELAYFSRADTCYPGEPALELAGFRDDTLTFPHTYVVPLGDNIGEEALDEAIDGVAEYVFLNCATGAKTVFDATRNEQKQSDDAQSTATVGTFGIHPLSDTNNCLPSQFAEVLCKALITDWLGGTEAEIDDAPTKLAQLRGSAQMHPDPAVSRRREEEASRLLARHGATERELIERVEAHSREILQGSADEYFERFVTDLMRSEGRDTSLEDAFAMLDAVLGVKDDDSQQTATLHVESLPDALLEPLGILADEMGQGLSEEALQMVTTSVNRIAGAREAAAAIIATIRSLKAKAATAATEAAQEASSLRESVEGVWTAASGRRDLAQKQRAMAHRGMVEYALARHRGVVFAGVGDVLRRAESMIAQSADLLRDLWRGVTHLRNSFQPCPEHSREIDENARLCEQWNLLLNRQEDLVKRFDESCEVRLLDDNGALAHWFENVDEVAAIVRDLRMTARQLTTNALKQIHSDSLRELVTNDSSWAGDCLDSANPDLSACGGEKRLVLIASGAFDSGHLAQVLHQVSGEEATIVSESNQDCVLCYEVRGLKLANVADHLIQHRAEVVELARRLHTRIDVDFS